MDMLKRLGSAVDYIEAHLCDGPDVDELARITCVTGASFLRMFSYLTGMPLGDYVRRRRMTLAAYELRAGMKVVDAAVKYGYESADSFARAFARQHGVPPSRVRAEGCAVRVFPPASFHITVEGAKEMEMRIIKTGGVRLRGLSKEFTGAAADRFEQEHIMLGLEHDLWMKRVSPDIPGTWYGIWDAGTYWIARAEDEADAENMLPAAIPAGIYAAFTTGTGGFAGAELPKLRGQIFGSWLPDSGCAQTRDYEIEVYRLFPDGEKHRRQYEIWIPIDREPTGRAMV